MLEYLLELPVGGEAEGEAGAGVGDIDAALFVGGHPLRLGEEALPDGRGGIVCRIQHEDPLIAAVGDVYGMVPDIQVLRVVDPELAVHPSREVGIGGNFHAPVDGGGHRIARRSRIRQRRQAYARKKKRRQESAAEKVTFHAALPFYEFVRG